MSGRGWLAGAICLLASPASALDALGELRTALACQTAPVPADLLLDLREEGLLGTAAELVDDQPPCWPIEGGLFWRGVEFTDICAVVDDERMARRYPDLFGANALSAVDGIWLGTRMPEAMLAQWAAANLGDGTRVTVAATETGAELGCNSWPFPLAETAQR